MNPPFRYAGKFAHKLIAEFEAGRVSEAIVLTPNRAGAHWFEETLALHPRCVPKGRIGYWQPGTVKAAPTFASVFTYIGPNVARFAEVFGKFGRIECGSAAEASPPSSSPPM